MSWPVMVLPKPDLERVEGVEWDGWSTPEGAPFVSASAKVDRRPEALEITYEQATSAHVEWIEHEWEACGRGAEPRSLDLPDGSGSLDVLFEGLSLESEQTGYGRHRLTLRFVEAL